MKHEMLALARSRVPIPDAARRASSGTRGKRARPLAEVDPGGNGPARPRGRNPGNNPSRGDHAYKPLDGSRSLPVHGGRGDPGRRSTLAAVPRPRRPGRLRETGLPDRLGRRQERRLEDADPRPRPFVARRVGRPHLPDHRRSRARSCRAPRASSTSIDGQDFVHPDGVGADRRHTLKVLALDARTRADPLGEDRLGRDALRHAPQARQLRLADADHRRQARLRLLRVRGRSSPTTSTASWRGRRRLGGIATIGVGVGTSPVLYKDLLILQCDEDDGDKSFIVALDKHTGKEVWRAPRKVQVSWATPVLVRAGGRDELVTSGHGVRSSPTTRPRARSCGGPRAWRATPCPRRWSAGDVVVLSAGYPEKLAMAIRAGRHRRRHRHAARPVEVHQGHGLRAVARSLYDGYVYLVTDKGLLTCLDARTGEVKYEGGRVAGAGHVHGVAGRVRRAGSCS